MKSAYLNHEPESRGRHSRKRIFLATAQQEYKMDRNQQLIDSMRDATNRELSNNVRLELQWSEPIKLRVSGTQMLQTEGEQNP
jgi:hypothetical protein